MGMGMGGAQQMGFNAEAAYKNEKEALGIAKHQVKCLKSLCCVKVCISGWCLEISLSILCRRVDWFLPMLIFLCAYIFFSFFLNFSIFFSVGGGQCREAIVGLKISGRINGRSNRSVQVSVLRFMLLWFEFAYHNLDVLSNDCSSSAMWILMFLSYHFSFCSFLFTASRLPPKPSHIQ